MHSVSAAEKGPDMRPATTSSSRYAEMASMWRAADAAFGMMTVEVRGGIEPRGNP